jgi:leucyl aminopeptidase (aminopeptidase T)
MKNVGGTFPIGEVFTEPKDLSQVNGDLMIFAFAEMNHQVREFEPFRVRIENGMLSVPGDAPASFHEILEMIRGQEQVMIREFGLGLNRAMGKGRPVSDITAFERMSGLHLSIGAKHAIYKKPGLPAKKMRYHVDVFADIREITIDGEVIYANGAFQVGGN